MIETLTASRSGAAISRQRGKHWQYIYGIIPAVERFADTITGVDESDAVHTIPCGGLTAVVSGSPRGDYRGLPRQEVLPYLLAHQRVIEAVMQDCTVLPCRFGTVVPGPAQVSRLLEQGFPLFRKALHDLAGKVQMEIIVSWSLPRVFEEIGHEAEIAGLKGQILSRPPAETAAERVAIGQLVKNSLERRRTELHKRLLPRFAQIALDLTTNPLMDDSMVLNVAVLVNRTSYAMLDRILLELDDEFSHDLHFRCVGPLPPYSFAAVEVKVPSFEELDSARRLLGLGMTASLVEIKHAYHRHAAEVHPDINPSSAGMESQMAELTRAFKLVGLYESSRCAGRTGDTCSFSRRAVAQTLLISIVRQEEVACRPQAHGA